MGNPKPKPAAQPPVQKKEEPKKKSKSGGFIGQGSVQTATGESSARNTFLGA